LHKYGLSGKAPRGVIEYLEAGKRGEAPETPKSLDNCFNYIIGDNRLALEAMKEKAASLGYKTDILSSEQTGDTAVVAARRAEEVKGLGGGCRAYAIGGETTVRLPEQPGHGGRNQHYVAVSLLAMGDYPGEWLVASIGTDGADFLPGVAGAVVDGASLMRARREGLDIAGYIKRCDSYSLFERLGASLVLTGDTGTNVGDVMLYILP
jgi:glycerate-2-kinase